MLTDSIYERNAMMQRIRAFFYSRKYVEVETPIRIKIPCMELHIDAEISGDWYLRTSPEIYHKQLLAAGHDKIFEMGKCFRSGELGPLHNPEYTMLEWYSAGADYMDMLDETKALVEVLWPSLADEWIILSVKDAFLTHAGWNPVSDFDEDRFDVDLIDKVEPAIKNMGGAVVLKDYPIEAAALSRKKPDHPELAERWELYIDGVELANAYSELTDPEEQRVRFEECAAQRQKLGKQVYAIDEAFIKAIENMPPSGGVALGIDRLLMLTIGEASLDSVLPFR